jgi:hypothetical protein
VLVFSTALRRCPRDGSNSRIRQQPFPGTPLTAKRSKGGAPGTIDVSRGHAVKAHSPIPVVCRQTTLATSSPAVRCCVANTVLVVGSGESLLVSGGSVAATGLPIVATGESMLVSVISAAVSGESLMVRPLTRGIQRAKSSLSVLHRSIPRSFIDRTGANRSPTGREFALTPLALAPGAPEAGHASR